MDQKYYSQILMKFFSISKEYRKILKDAIFHHVAHMHLTSFYVYYEVIHAVWCIWTVLPPAGTTFQTFLGNNISDPFLS